MEVDGTKQNQHMPGSGKYGQKDNTGEDKNTGRNHSGRPVFKCYKCGNLGHKKADCKVSDTL